MLMRAGWASAKNEMLELQANCTTTHEFIAALASPAPSLNQGFSPEPVDAGGVLDGDRLAGVVDVAVLADPLIVASGLLLRDGSVLLSEGRSELAVAHVEPLLLQDSGEGGIAIELGRGEG